MARISFLWSLAALFLSTDVDARALDKRASLQQVTDYGDNPAGVPMYIYVPDNLATNPGIIAAVHYCTGTAEAYYTNSPYATLAEQYGFIVIYPSSPHDGTCWDVSSQATLTHNGGGDSNSIANMVTYTIDKYGADTTKVFVTGMSSGAMMTNVLAATYPDLFSAGIAYAGVPAGCFLSTANAVAGWNSTCSSGQSITTPEHWASIAEAMDPDYTGTYPRMQIYHGSEDTTLNPQNYYETVKQWTGVWAYDYENPESVVEDSPVSGWTRTTWGEGVEGILAGGVGHSISIQGTGDMEWFGFV